MNLKIQLTSSLCVVLVLSGIIPICSANPALVLTAAQYGWKAIQGIMSIKTAVNNHNFKGNVRKALDEIRDSTTKIETLIPSETDRVINTLSVKIDMKIVNDFQHTMYEINTRFENQFLRYFLGNDIYERHTIDDYINKTISTDKFGKTLSEMKEYFVSNQYFPIKNKRVLDVVSDYLKIKKMYYTDCKKYGDECIFGESDYEVIFKVFNLAISSISKGYTMVVHSYKYLQLNSTNPNAWSAELRDASNDYKQTIFEIADAARTVSNAQSRAIRRYEPSQFIEGENYESLQFLTTLLYDRLFEKKRGKELLERKYREHSTGSFCVGTTYNCNYRRNIGNVYLAPQNSKRRYDYVTETGPLGFGQYYKGRKTQTRDIDRVINDNGFKGNIQLCTCEESPDTQRTAYLNMSLQFSDFIHTDRVITGIRLVTKMSITYFEIQRGAIVNGTIDKTTVSWDDRVTKNFNYMIENNIRPSLNDKNLHRLTHSQRIFNMDDIVLPKGWVAIDIQFRELQDDHLSFRIAGLKMFDDFGNYVKTHEIEWFEPVTNYRRSELTQPNQDIPTFADHTNPELGTPGNNYVKFQMTGWDVDASQSLYPFIDMQPVFTDPPMPLGGIGLYYKSYEGFGGFIAPKIITIDYDLLMSDDYLNRVFQNSNYNAIDFNRGN